MKKAIVVGATSGIGKGLAQYLLEKNYIVGITGRREDLLEELVVQAPASCFSQKIDVTETDTLVQKLEALTTRLGGLDLLIISAGTGDLNEKLDFEIEKKTIATNVVGFTGIADWSFHYFEKQQSGHLVAISSVGGIRGSGMAPAYNASKAYQINYLEGLRQKATKLGGHISVTDIRPGLVDTAMAKGEGLFWVMPVEKVVHQIALGIDKKKPIVYVTRRWRIIAGILRVLPAFVYNRM
jgi:short-subunit dehydrogenase